MSAPVVATGHFLLAEAGSRGWHAHDVGDRRWRDVGGHAWEGETVRSCHPLSASLWACSRRWREGAVREGTADGVELHLLTTIVTRVYSYFARVL